MHTIKNIRNFATVCKNAKVDKIAPLFEVPPKVVNLLRKTRNKFKSVGCCESGWFVKLFKMSLNVLEFFVIFLSLALTVS